MARPIKKTADWFPHYVTSSKTKFILEEAWGNDGYAFWFKLLELLCKSNGHFYDCSGVMGIKFLAATARVREDTLHEILDTLADMRKIDRELWYEKKVIWCQTLVDNLDILYSKRRISVPEKPLLQEFPGRKPEQVEVCGDGNRHITLHYNTLDNNTPPYPPRGESAGEAEPETENLQPGESLTVIKTAGTAAGSETREQPSMTLAERRFDEFWTAYPKKVGRKAAWMVWSRLKPSADLHNKIILAIGRAMETEQWRRENGRFIPNPSTWLNQGRWDDVWDDVHVERQKRGNENDWGYKKT